MFVFRLRKHDQPLPFGHKMKVLYGGLLGMKQSMSGQSKDELTVVNIHALINQAKDHYGAFENLPFQDIIKSIASYQHKRK